MSSVSPSRLSRPRYTIDTPSKERVLQRANHVLTKIVVEQKSVVDCKRPACWVPGVGSVARALRLAKERSKDPDFQQYVQKYVDYDPVGDAELRKLQEMQQQERQQRPASAASSRCSFGSGRRDTSRLHREVQSTSHSQHLAADVSSRTTQQQQQQPQRQQRPSSASALRNDSIFSPEGYILPRTFTSATQDPCGNQQSSSSSPSTPNPLVASESNSSPMSNILAVPPSRRQSRSARMTAIDSNSMAITSSVPFKVWMEASWEDASQRAATAGAGAGVPSSSSASKERKRADNIATAHPPVIDIRQGSAAGAMISSAFMQIPSSLHHDGSMSRLTSPLAPSTGSVVVPREYGVAYRAHQHLVFHLPQGNAGEVDAMSNTAIAGDSFAGLSSTGSGSFTGLVDIKLTPPNGGASGMSANNGTKSGSTKSSGAADVDSIAAEEKRLLANYGFRSRESSGRQERSSSKKFLRD